MSSLPHNLFTAAQVRELDRLTIEEFGIPGYALMNRAGEAAFSIAMDKWPQLKTMVVVCGIGNNAGDGFVFARLARQAGYEVRVLQLGDAARLRGDALTAAKDMEAIGLHALAFEPGALEGVDLVVDALFGTGLDRPVTDEWRTAIEAINASGARVLALDIPSGLHADNGAPLGVVVHAHMTVTFIGLKRGLFTGEGPEYCGDIVYDGLGVPTAVFDRVTATAQRLAAAAASPLLARRGRTVHKGDNGHVLIIGGDHGMAGAARMAAEAAARVGAGLVTVATRQGNVNVINAGRPELMCHGVDGPDELDDVIQRASVVAVGPGLGRSEWGRTLFTRALASRLPLVVDADGLNLLSEAPQGRGNWILTPHPGEAARLLGRSTAMIQSDRFAAIEALRRRYNGVVVLKGAGTLVLGDTGVIGVCDEGNPGMASGGMGDILTGVIAGLLAQGLRQKTPMELVARVGVGIHAQAADLAAADGERGMLATDLLPHLRRLVNPSIDHGRNHQVVL